MINSFETEFDTRERKQQQEHLYSGETVDLVASLTRDGVPLDLAGCTVNAFYQPASKKGSTDWYQADAGIVSNRVVVHWTVENQTATDTRYYIWALVQGSSTDDVAYPCSWVLDTAYSPSFPVGEIQPAVKTIDFSQYQLVNDPWLRVEKQLGVDVDPSNVDFTGEVTIENLSADIHVDLSPVTDRLDSTTYGLDALHRSLAELTDPDNGLPKALYDLANINALLIGSDGLNSIAGTLSGMWTDITGVKDSINDSYIGLAAIKANISGIGGRIGQPPSGRTLADMIGVDPTENFADLAEMVDAVIQEIGYPTYGLQAIKSAVTTVDGRLTNNSSGLAAIKGAVDGVRTYISDDGDYSLPTIKGTADDIFAAVDQMACYDLPGIVTKLDTIDGRLTNGGSGLVAIRGAVADVSTLLTNNSYGLASIQGTANNAYNAANGAASVAGNAYGAANAAYGIVNNNAYGNAALAALLGDVAAALDAINGETL